MPLIMQGPPAITEPVEMEDFGAPDFMAHGWTMQWSPEIITGVSWIERFQSGRISRHVVARVHYPRSRWMTALDATLIGLRGDRQH